MSRIPTASQTVGPFFHFALTDGELGTVAGEDVPGERIRLEIEVVDGDGGHVVHDGVLELWQADSMGRYAQSSADFRGFGRLATDDHGCCTFQTIKPGRVPGPEGRTQAPHINVIVFARGLLKHLHTRIYFAGDPANGEDAVLALVPEERRGTLLAQPVEGQPGNWQFRIRLQGDGETVFFDV
ncbi:MAG: protocatechuate 3,4-dioxygenase subunit alpha [Candidatus Solibacter sp.]